MRTIITTDVQTGIRTVEQIRLTKNGVVSNSSLMQVSKSEMDMILQNSTSDEVVDTTNDKNNVFLRVDGDVIYKDRLGLTITKTSDGYSVYDFPSAPMMEDDFVNLECNNQSIVDENIIFNIKEVFFIGFDFVSIEEYSEDAMVKLFMDSQFMCEMKITDLINGKYHDITTTAPEDADEETKLFYEEKNKISMTLNSNRFRDTQVKIKIYISGNINNNAKGYISIRTHSYALDYKGELVVDDMTNLDRGVTTDE